ncbi:mannose-ethanolamine phosphotransferase gpi13 [Kalmusia sp. IMI 367209]|nr:mannose-ethanolamine phosphotransferase gpi13 [Kalmusia sp. IMI 367209]
MDNGGPAPSYEGIAAAFAKAKAEKEKQESQGLKPTTADAAAAKKQGEVRFKALHGLLVAFFAWILILHVLGIYLFTSGFLLTRLVLDHKSECAVPPVETNARAYTPGSSEAGCWHPKTFDKAIVILVDALRYDFTIPFPTKGSDESPHHFHNALPVLYETAVEQPNNAFLLPFIADAPTATLQRLKGLTTGTLPTFVDAGSNFAGTAIDEDNLIAQLRNASKRVVHLGDDTWHALFPGHFEPDLTHAYDSFNVWDLHTVDNGVTDHIFPLMHASNTTKWDVMIGHYLGVDHAGHRYGPDHPAMAAKLKQMDEIIRKMIEQLDDSTLLVVMGDHGMDAKGDHGGESDDEIQAALWMYSKQKKFGRSSPAYNAPPATAKERPVAQIDLVPTLSLLLGLPIPFNNLGKPIEEAFIGSKGTDFENIAIVNRLTAAQIYRYQKEYALVRSMDEESRASSLSSFKTANDAWDATNKKTRSSSEYAHVYEMYKSYQRETLDICRALWASFDIPRMLNGVTILAFSLVILAVYARGLDGDRSELSPVLLGRGMMGTVLGCIVGFGVNYVSPEVPRQHAIIYAAAVCGNVGIASAFWYLRRRLLSLLPNSIWGWLSVIFTLLLSVGFAANSFTIWEDEILLHFLSTFGLLAALSSFRQNKTTDRVLGCYHSILFIILTRIASLSRLCREEQMPFCKSTYYASATSSTSSTWQLAIPFIVALLLPSFIRSYYDGTLSYHGSAVLWLGFALRFGLLLSAAYWTLDAADDGDWYPGFGDKLKTSKTVIAQITLVIAVGFGYPIFTWAKPLLNIESKPTHEPHPSKQIVADGGRNSIAILGYANVHGSRYALLITMWYLAVALVQKPMGAGAIAIAAWQIFSLFEIVDTNKLSDSSIGPVVLGLLGSFHFFKTGHQATPSSIQWESAFIPLHTIRYPWSPLLIILNTFGAQILCAVAVPALVLWKQPPKKKGLLGDVAKAMATHVLFYAVINLATTMWAGHLRRHLMLYRIFSPRFMMGALVLIIVDVVGIFIAIGGTRMSFLSVAEVFGTT